MLLAAALWFNRPFRGVTWAILRFPLSAVESLLSTLVLLPRLPSLVHDNAALRGEAAARQLELVRLRDELRRLTHAGSLLHAAKTSSMGGTPETVASIVGRTLLPTEHTVIINRGTRDGMVPDTVLLAAEGVAGRVLEVHPKTSVATLVTDPNSRIACLVERSREFGLLVGTGGRFGELLYVDVDADVAVGDQIVTAGLGGAFPKGLLLGTVVKVVRDEQAAALSVWVRPAVRVNRLEEVLCLRPASS